MPLPLSLAGFAAKPFVAPIVSFFRKITLRQWLIFFATLAIVFTLWKGYNWIYDRGAHSRNAEVAQLQSELKAERDKISRWNTETARAKQKFASEQEALRKSLQTQLDEANEKAKLREVIIREIPKYITVADDAECTIPVNFGLLHNVSIEGQDTSTPDRLSESTTGQRGTPSSLTLSQYAEVASYNNSEAVRRGKIIEQWETWYDVSKEQFTRAQQEAAQTILEQAKASGPEPAH